jgi:hypothetical protein
MLRRVGFAALAMVVVAACVLLMRPDRPDAAAPVVWSAPDGVAAAQAADARPASAGAEPIRSAAASSRTVARRAAPHRGVRGIVTSPRITIAGGARGVDPAGWEATVYALVPSAARRTVDRIGIIKRRAPGSARGDFEIDLPIGRHLVLIEHRAPVASGRTVLEAWTAVVDVALSQRTPIDLGAHAFSAAFVSGRVIAPPGISPVGIPVSCSDDGTGAGVLQGVPIRVATAEDGWFAFSLVRQDGVVSAVDLSAATAGMRAGARGITQGAFVELELGFMEPVAETTISIPATGPVTLWIHARDRRLYSMTQSARRGGDAVLEEIRVLPLGRYVVEVFRESGAAGGEWAAHEFVVADAAPHRVAFVPSFRPGRDVAGRVEPGERVAWITRATDGSSFVRQEVEADSEGRFVLSALPAEEVLVASSGRVRVVEAGPPGVLELGSF